MATMLAGRGVAGIGAAGLLAVSFCRRGSRVARETADTQFY